MGSCCSCGGQEGDFYDNIPELILDEAGIGCVDGFIGSYNPAAQTILDIANGLKDKRSSIRDTFGFEESDPFPTLEASMKGLILVYMSIANGDISKVKFNMSMDAITAGDFNNIFSLTFNGEKADFGDILEQAAKMIEGLFNYIAELFTIFTSRVMELKDQFQELYETAKGLPEAAQADIAGLDPMAAMKAGPKIAAIPGAVARAVAFLASLIAALGREVMMVKDMAGVLLSSKTFEELAEAGKKCFAKKCYKAKECYAIYVELYHPPEEGQDAKAIKDAEGSKVTPVSPDGKKVANAEAVDVSANKVLPEGSEKDAVVAPASPAGNKVSPAEGGAIEMKATGGDVREASAVNQ